MTDETDATRASDVAFIKALAELLDKNDLTEIQVKREYSDHDWLNVRVARGGVMMQPQMQFAPQAPMAPHSPSLAPSAPAPSGDPSDAPGAVASPMVGTVYLQAEPGSKPFVSVGDQVTEGQTLLIVEAMKTMNQIPAPRAGTVKRILVEDGAPVEYGAPLMIIE